MNKAFNVAFKNQVSDKILKANLVLFSLSVMLLFVSFYYFSYVFFVSIPFSFLFIYGFYINFSKVLSKYNYLKKKIEYLPDGHHKIERIFNRINVTESVQVLDGKRIGISKLLYKNGDIASETTYDKGCKNGVHKEYHMSGLLKTESCYKNNLKDGTYREYYEDGQLKISHFYVDDKKDGENEEYFNNGQIKIQEHYQNFLRHGTHNEYYENGQLKTSSVFEKGDQLSTHIYSMEGILLRKSIFIDNEYGDVYEYYDDGSLKLFNNQSKYIFYYPLKNKKPIVCCEINLLVNEDNLSYKYRYHNNNFIVDVIGVWQEYRDDGSLERKLEFQFERDGLKEKLIEINFNGSLELDEEVIEGDKYYLALKENAIKNTENTLSKENIVKITQYNDSGDIIKIFISEYNIIKSSLRNFYAIYAKDRLLSKEIVYDTGMRGPPGINRFQTISFSYIEGINNILYLSENIILEDNP